MFFFPKTNLSFEGTCLKNPSGHTMMQVHSSFTQMIRNFSQNLTNQAKKSQFKQKYALTLT